LLLPLGENVELRIASRSGRVVVRAEERGDIAVVGGQDRVQVSHDETGALTLTAGSQSLDVRCPTGTQVTVGTSSGAVELSGRLGAVRVTSSNGRITVEHASVADLRSGSGSVRIGECDGFCRVQTRSGSAEVGSCGRVEASSASGPVSIGRASGRVNVRSASGKVEVTGDGREDVAVQTMSGAVKVTLPPGTRPAAKLHSLTGRSRCDCDEGEDCRVAVQSLNGKIEVVPG
jgi:DUF4097 and DUF4098 domain-containing protein YvlB